jgi:hypothetical protein
MSIEVSLGTMATVIALNLTMSAAFSYFGQRKSQSEREKTEEEIIKEKVDTLTSSLNRSADLISEVTEHINQRHELVEKLKKDHEKYQNLVNLKEEEVQAVAQILRGELKQEGKSSFRKSFLMNSLFFLMGSAVSVVVTAYAV